MCRANPEKLKKIPGIDYYVVNDPLNDVIPYRLLIKKVCKITFAKNIIQKNNKNSI